MECPCLLLVDDMSETALASRLRYAYLQSGERLLSGISSRILQMKEKLEIQIQMSKLDKIFGALWEITHSGIMLFVQQNFMFPTTIFRYLCITLMSRDKRKRALTFFMRQPSMIIGQTDGDKSLSEPWIGVTRFELLNTNSPEGHMWVQCRPTKKQVTTSFGYI